ncbi:MAG: L-threonylcarbamoyladenylate synthase [Candidatus Nanopelagicales bacterium]
MSTTDAQAIADAAATALLAGHLAILPTETVYGLAARADDPEAVAGIYAAKGRPLDHPVIVHVADGRAALETSTPQAWAREVPPYAHALAAAFWPGPMSLVLLRAPRSGDHVTGGQDTVALRVPGHPLAREVLCRMDELDPAGAPHGVAAPSANRFGRVSPTTAEHAMEEFAEVLDPVQYVVVDGGTSDVGLESTIVDCTGEVPRILRPGAVSAADVERATGLVTAEAGRGIRVPGALPSHYAPNAHLVLAPDGPALCAVLDSAIEAGLAPDAIGVIAPGELDTPEGARRLLAPMSHAEYARGLYAAMRAADRDGLRMIVAIPPERDAEGIGDAVADRLRRAAAPRPGSLEG